MSTKKTGFEDSLLSEVIKPKKCTSCGACIRTCPLTALKLINNEPKLVKECKACGMCTQVCPQYNFQMANAEEYVFGRKRTPEEEFGVFRRITIARAKPTDIQNACQDGGAATAMLIAALQNGLINGAVVAAKSSETPFLPIPIIATTPKQIIESAGTKYTCASSILALPKESKQKNLILAFVGTPCQIHALRKMQMNNITRLTASVKYLMGLMCSECFDYHGLMEKHIKGKLGINTSEITKMNIKGKMLVTTSSGVFAIPLAEVKPYVRLNCGFCEDFSSELADVSVGGIGLDGWTLVIIRTEKGEELLRNAEKSGFLETRQLEQDSLSERLLLKFSKKKRAATTNM